MRKRLGKKSTITSEQWKEAYENAEKYVSREEIDELVRRTITRLRVVIMQRGYKRIGYGWSGGKDSLVAYKVLELAGIRTCSGIFVGFPTIFPSMLRWYKEKAPKNCVIRYASRPTLKDINENIELLFPVESNRYNTYLWDAQNQWKKEFDIDVMITGRRIIDDNFCGGKKNNYVVSNKYGDSFNIIADWSHEELLAFIKYYNIELPESYFYGEKWRFDTHGWTERYRLGEYPFTENFDEIFEIDKNILFDARNELALADEYLKNRGL